MVTIHPIKNVFFVKSEDINNSGELVSLRFLKSLGC